LAFDERWRLSPPINVAGFYRTGYGVVNSWTGGLTATSQQHLLFGATQKPSRSSEVPAPS
jgi:hypothetical protein